MQQNATKRERAALLLAEDELTDETIAASVKIHRATLDRWKHDPDFAALVGDARGKIIADALKLPIARKHKRVEALNTLHESYWQIKNQRAAAYAALLPDTPDTVVMREFGHAVPEWATSGMLLAQPKISASGKIVTEWAFDKALDSAIKETHKQAAQELGQWEETLTVNHNPYRNEALHHLSDDDLDEIESILDRRNSA